MGSGASNQISSMPGAVHRERSLTNSNTNSVDDQRTKPRGSSFTPATSDSDQSGSKAAKNGRSAKKTENQQNVVRKSESLSPMQHNSSSNVLQRKDADIQDGSCCEHLSKLKRLENELASSESQRLDLQDQITALQENNSKLADQHLPMVSGSSQSLSETLHAKDQYIQKLEQDLKNAQAEFHKTCLKLKRRIRNLTNQLHEVRQEASIRQMELSSQVTQQKEMGAKTLVQSANSSTDGDINSYSHSKVIVELSSQLSEQSEEIATLKADLLKKDQKLMELETAMKEKTMTTSQNEMTMDHPEHHSVDRLPSGRGQRVGKNCHDNLLSSQKFLNSKQPGKREFASDKRPDLVRQSTVLSDSDSDWEMDSVPSQTLSAPARTRVKSALSTSSDLRSKGDTLSLLGDDDSIVDLNNQSETAISTPYRARTNKKSMLKNRLEMEKKEKESRALMGPSLAFATKSKEPPSDTSCEPTPRYADPSKLPGFSKLKVVHHTGY